MTVYNKLVPVLSGEPGPFVDIQPDSINMASAMFESIEIPGDLLLTTVHHSTYPTIYATGYWNTKYFKIGYVYNIWSDLDAEFIINKLAYTVANHLDLDARQFNEIRKAFMAMAKYDTIKTANSSSEVGINKDKVVSEIEKKSQKLPGMNAVVKVQCNCYTGEKAPLWNHIQHLNDSHFNEWTREKIADWLEELHNSGTINLEFEPWRTEEEILNDED